MAMMMSNFDYQKSNDLFTAQAHVTNLMFNFVTSMSLNCAIQLDIIEAIHKHGEPMTLSELVEALPINKARAPFVYRLMRILVHSGFFVALNDTSKIAKIGEREVAYLLTPPSLLLLKNEQSSLRPEYLATVGPILGKPWHVLSEWLKNDDSTPFETAYGKSFWDFAGENPNFNDGFNEAMASESRSVASLVIKECKGVFEGISSVVDVGGGTGVLARAIADAFPHLSCTVLDLPHVVANLKGSGNLSYVVGNMFESIHQADVVLLKSILHDWSDEECVKILKKCKEAIPSKENGGMAIIISVVVDNKNDEDYYNKSLRTKLFLDLLMMVQVGGKERTEKEWEKIFTNAGFSDYKITSSVLGLNSLIYVFP